MNSLKCAIFCLFISSILVAQKKSVQLKILVSKDYVGKIFIRNRSDIILEINLKKKNIFATSFDIEEGIYQLKYDTFYTDIYLKNGFNLIITFDALQFYETLKFVGVGANENNFIASEFKKDENLAANSFYNLTETDFEAFLLTTEKTNEDSLLIGSFDAFFIEYEKKSIKAQLLKIRDLYQDRKLRQKNSDK